MEWLWIIFAAILGGVANGVAGVSAATIIVPMLIVFCPTFAGDAGAFQAITLSLTCDVASSAVTTRIYQRHGNIDLKRAAPMSIAIVMASIVGSIAAWYTGGVVLGSITLVLCLANGIRYLVKPESNARPAEHDGFTGLSFKVLAFSVICGLGIGFSTGFVGAGGGVMMCIIFTLFMGYSTRSAVGTATFIMTFTTLIAAAVHYAMDVSLLTDHLPIVIVTLAIATASSIASARFANRVSERTIGLTTGIVLTILGAGMMLVYYWEPLMGLFAV